MSLKIGYEEFIEREPTSCAEREAGMIVCQCAGVSDQAIVQMVREGARTVADIARRSGAGLCCAPCQREIALLLATASPGESSRATAAV